MTLVVTKQFHLDGEMQQIGTELTDAQSAKVLASPAKRACVVARNETAPKAATFGGYRPPAINPAE